MSDPQSILREAARLASAILQAHGGGCPAEWPEDAQQLTHDAVRLAQLHQEIFAAVSIGYCVRLRERIERSAVRRGVDSLDRAAMSRRGRSVLCEATGVAGAG